MGDAHVLQEQEEAGTKGKRNPPIRPLAILCNSKQSQGYLPEQRSFRINGHGTTIRLESAYWAVLEEIARDEGETVATIVNTLYDHCRQVNDRNLASCLRVACLKYINLSS